MDSVGLCLLTLERAVAFAARIRSCFRLRHRPSSMKSCDAQSLASQPGIIPAASVS